MNDFKSIKNWDEDDRPREKMTQKGAAALTDAELLAILISSGTKEKSALDLAREAQRWRPRYAEALYLEAVALANLGDLPGAGRAVSAALEADPTHPSATALANQLRARAAPP
jgi:DNA repair protein RadC